MTYPPSPIAQAIGPLCGMLCSLLALPTQAADTAAQVVVTATRSETPAFDVPASIDRVAPGSDRAGVNLSESLGAVPGLLARDRQNYAQDTQLSVRGFGARASFGIRGVRLYVDGIPATMPDGQSQGPKGPRAENVKVVS